MYDILSQHFQRIAIVMRKTLLSRKIVVTRTHILTYFTISDPTRYKHSAHQARIVRAKFLLGLES